MNYNEPIDKDHYRESSGSTHDSFRLKAMQMKIEAIEKKLNQTSILLYILAGLTLVVAFIGIGEAIELGGYYFLAAVGIDSIMIITFLISAILMKKNPLLWTAIPLGVFSFFHLLTILVDPAMLIQGILIKAVVLISLINGIGNARQLKKLKKELELEQLSDLSGQGN